MTWSWMNEPPGWREQGDGLAVTTAAGTDFWNRTYYGFIRDSGHFRYRMVSGDFSAAVQVAADYRTLYDQAGLMVWCDGDNWLKAGIEFTDGAMHASTVVTRAGYSDWSQQPVDERARHAIDLRLTRHGEALRVQYRLAAEPWRMIRLAMLPMAEAVRVGVMCCSPERGGLEVRFRHFEAGPPIDRALHAE